MLTMNAGRNYAVIAILFTKIMGNNGVTEIMKNCTRCYLK